MEHIVIIGNGISGVTAARHIRKLSDKQITIVSAETDYFFSRTALMYIYMGHLKFEHTQPYEPWFWKKNNIHLKKGYVSEINTDKKELFFAEGDTLSYDKLIIATGSKPNKFGWPGQDLNGVIGMYHKQDLENLEKYAPDNKKCKRAVIVGGGLIGIELAEMLHSRNIPVTFLVRESSFWNGVLPKQESAMINKEIIENHIDLRLETNLKEIKSDEHGNVKSIVIAETGEEIECNLVGLTAGVSPNIDFIRDADIETGRGVKVNRFLETNMEGIYAIGDCAEQHEGIGQRRPIEAVWYTGRMMGETVAQTICGNRIEYKPGHWFNSAKFIDIEYQTYGWVWAQPKENEARFYWEHKHGKKCIHISYDKNTREFIGINNFGIRMRHEFFDRVLTEKRSVEYVLEHLADANFDPEFYKLHEPEIVAQFNKENNTNIQLKKKSWKRIFSIKA
ncbi:NAD(P)/FAD-dependent oxidoreductase [Tenacibaculum maritimum]|uniref:NAD(P)/FAD-dependent oxidoreductase n=1 Tax=Tenacibaculum maritimum TaxID=107401 RepID=UPI0012E54BE1|nr:FAD/NAD(P)-binding oxidoreductase [Tenacibaculum maritimum]MCD9563282.1 NAD(P)/FAD-dependent oxidoreductase [Tenacibaculum maritimum]MCD9566419.1 NAD(P)/FAD-dependent oxidoreductase [Tenacibaculum maritimum]MCD9579940.1 NAD(P)/FAD-dependent oxidoreductase [Tenacibaculum maritimum]MCD9597141.1 NAD(P)/FAD-dependent oxidoreductase [Tenacibaculum maritimum]MCD9609530.1 NAD(P)/FAD-dependent oxidoreductase [Tenacibaculum maritimum]